MPSSKKRLEKVDIPDVIFAISNAQSIVDYRERHSNFKSMDELKSVPKLDFSKLEANKNMLVFN